MKLYVLGGFDWNNEPLNASEVYDFQNNEWSVIESTGHPRLRAPLWYKKGWQPEWQGIVLHNSSYFCSYKEDDSRAFVKHYDPDTGNWEFKKPKLKALLRFKHFFEISLFRIFESGRVLQDLWGMDCRNTNSKYILFECGHLKLNMYLFWNILGCRFWVG